MSFLFWAIICRCLYFLFSHKNLKNDFCGERKPWVKMTYRWTQIMLIITQDKTQERECMYMKSASRSFCLSFFGVEYPSITRLSGWWPPGQLHGTQEAVPDQGIRVYLMTYPSRWNLQVGEICKCLKWKKELGENEKFKKRSEWKWKIFPPPKLFYPSSEKMEQIDPHLYNVDKFTHYSSWYRKLLCLFNVINLIWYLQPWH